MVFTHTNICCHFIGTNFRYIASQYTEIEAIENTHQPNVHPDVRLLIEYQIESEEGQHHDDVANDAEAVAQFVYKVEPFVD